MTEVCHCGHSMEEHRYAKGSYHECEGVFTDDIPCECISYEEDESLWTEEEGE